MKISFLVFIVFFFLSSCSKEKKSDEAANRMQNFIIKISGYARNIDPDFIIIPQNGIELAYNNADPSEGLQTGYLDAIDGIGVEELFYNGSFSPDAERMDMLKELKESETILVSEYLKNDDDEEDAITRNRDEGFLCFPRLSNDYDYLNIPGNVPFENSNDINALSDVQNYLYLISTDNFESKIDMLTAIAATNFDMVLIDLFFEGLKLTPSEITMLKTKANGSKRLVIAYMNIGSAENYRYYWEKSWGLHHPGWIKRKYEGYSDEYWVKFWYSDWQKIIFGNDYSYTKEILNSGFDGAYLDNTEAYYFLYYRD